MSREETTMEGRRVRFRRDNYHAEAWGLKLARFYGLLSSQQYKSLRGMDNPANELKVLRKLSRQVSIEYLSADSEDAIETREFRVNRYKAPARALCPNCQDILAVASRLDGYKLSCDCCGYTAVAEKLF